jgi:carbohydrate-binding DOMON domain-containing protein
MDTVAMYDMTGTRLDDVVVKSYPDEASSSIFISFPRSAVEGADTWNAIVAMLGHDGYSDGQIRPVLSAGEQWYFGGCDSEDLCPAIIDLVVGDGPSQEDLLSSYKRTGQPADLMGIEIKLP